MEDISKFVAWIALALAVVGLIGLGGPRLGGYTSGYWDSADGYYVDGTAIIDGDGNVDGAVTSGSASTFADTVDITGAVTMSSTLGVSGESQMSTVVAGGSAYTTTTDYDSTTTAAYVCDYSVWSITPNGATLAWGLPSTTTVFADCLDTNGDYKDVLIDNATSGTSNITVSVEGTSSGSGFVVVSDDANGDVIAAAGNAILRFYRVDANTGIVTIAPFTDAD